MFKLSNFYKGKKILITGITGFKGAWLAAWLVQLGGIVYGIGFQPIQSKKLFYSLNLKKKVKLSFFDIRSYTKVQKLINKVKPEIIFHLAAQTLIYESYKKPYNTFDINFKGTLNIIDIAMQVKFIKSIVIATSDKCYESNKSTKGFKEFDRLGGIDPYSASKTSAEIMVRAYRKSFFQLENNREIGISTARAGNVIGGGDWSFNRLIPDCIRSIIKNKKIVIRNPSYNRPWQHVLEALKGYLILAMKQYHNPKKFSGAWNFGTKPNSVTSVKSMVNYIIDFWGSGKIILKNSKLYEQTNLQLNINKAKMNLGWKPTYNIKKSVKFTVDWYKSVLKLNRDALDVTLDQIKKYMNDSKIN